MRTGNFDFLGFPAVLLELIFRLKGQAREIIPVTLGLQLSSLTNTPADKRKEQIRIEILALLAKYESTQVADNETDDRGHQETDRRVPHVRHSIEIEEARSAEIPGKK